MKMTRILAFALCLALVLGMTAMAAPTEIIAVEDFESYADLTAFVSNTTHFSDNPSVLPLGAFQSTNGQSGVTYIRTQADYPDTVGNVQYPTKGTNQYNWFSYRAHTMALSTANGSKVLENSADGSMAVVYAFDEPWTYDYAKTNNKALVASVDAAVLRGTNTMVAGGQGFAFMANLGTESLRGCTYFNGGGMSFGLGTTLDGKVTAMTGDENFITTPGATRNFYQYGEEYAYPIGEFVNLTRVFAPFRYDGDTVDDKGTPETEDDEKIKGSYEYIYDNTGLGCLKVFNSHYVPGTAVSDDIFNPSFPIGEDDHDIVALEGFVFKGSGSAIQEQFDRLMVYELSLDPNDFYAETWASGAYNGLAVNGSVKIYFSQPITDVAEQDMEKDWKASNITKATKVTDSEGYVVPNTSYTAKVSQEVVGGEVKGVLTLKFDGLAYGENYTITLPGAIRNIARVAMPESANRTFAFTTAEPSSRYSVELTAKEGLANGATISSMAAAAGKTVTFTATAAKESGDNASKLVIGIYDNTGALVKYASMNITIAGDTTFSAVFKVGANQTAKAYVVGTNNFATIGQ